MKQYHYYVRLKTPDGLSISSAFLHPYITYADAEDALRRRVAQMNVMRFCDYQIVQIAASAPQEEPPPPADPVTSPAHYTMGGVEVLTAIEAWGLGFHLGNVVKYVARAGKKDPSKFLEDLKKAQSYLSRRIKLEESKQ